MLEAHYVDDRDQIEDAEIVRIDWPNNVVKPRVGIVKDFENYPRWTKYCRFLEKNSFPYTFYDIHAHDWIENAQKYDVVVGIVSNQLNHLKEIQEKYYFLETFLGKKCFPSAAHVFLYENKSLEAYISKFYDIPFAKTYISHSPKDALALAANLHYPLVSKINYSSGSVGIELVRTPKQARRIIEQAFSRNGRKVHVAYFRQKNYVYFQEFIPNDGYDIRVILVGNWAFGYYRKVLRGDFRASGMDKVEKRALPEEAIRTAWKAQKCIQSPQLVVDMLHGLDGNYSIIELSIVCKIRNSEQLKVNGIPGVYIIEDNGVIRFEKGRYWTHELALRKFLLDEYLPYVQLAHTKTLV
jgi:glutathione synthase/RimK-type ligase-like ATP-grasp enzyme